MKKTYFVGKVVGRAFRYMVQGHLVGTTFLAQLKLKLLAFDAKGCVGEAVLDFDDRVHHKAFAKIFLDLSRFFRPRRHDTKMIHWFLRFRRVC